MQCAWYRAPHDAYRRPTLIGVPLRSCSNSDQAAMSSATPPPLGNITNIGQGGGRSAAARESTAVETAGACNDTMRHVRQVAAADARRDADLYDLLANTRREETYQPYFQGVRLALCLVLP